MWSGEGETGKALKHLMVFIVPEGMGGLQSFSFLLYTDELQSSLQVMQLITNCPKTH